MKPADAIQDKNNKQNVSETAPKKGYYVENMLRTSKENIDAIEKLCSEINKAATELEPKQHSELLERIAINVESLVKIKMAADKFRKELTHEDVPLELKTALGAHVDEMFELRRQFHILNLDLRALKFDTYFKFDSGVKISKELRREVLHTLQIRIPDFNNYFKYKIKTGSASTDYRLVIKYISFQGESATHCLQALSNNPDFLNTKLGKEKVFIAEFPKLSREEFSLLSQRISDLNDAVVNRVFLRERNSIIFFMKDLQAKTMDLHGLDLKMATERYHASIRNAFLNFEDSVTILSGIGNHSASGKSVIQSTLLKQLKFWQDSDKYFIQSYQIDPKNKGAVKIKFCAPTIMSQTNFISAISMAAQHQVHRIVVTLDKKYPAHTLESIAIKFILQTLGLGLHPKLTSSGVKQSSVDCNFVRLFFSYNNKNVQLLDEDSDLLSNFNQFSIRSIPDAKIEPVQTSAASTATAAAGTATASQIKASPKSHAKIGKPILHAQILQKNQKSTKKEHSNGTANIQETGKKTHKKENKKKKK